ncbi:MAG: ParM/StbA family protein [Gammaproteobacteria bacterium]|nr:ParM/StbA family protein [Gammaproteobacteria bacterium]
MQIVAIDIGFGFTKATNGKKSLIFKSVFGDATEVQFKEKFIAETAEDDQLAIEYEGKAYFVGELAERQSSERRFTLDQEQFVSSFTKILALPAIARLAGEQTAVKLVVGLPISHYRRYKKELKNLLVGLHAFKTIDAQGERHDANIRVSDVKVVPQPFGTVLNAFLDSNGDVKDRRFAQEKVGVIDIGFRTTDYTIADKARYSERGSRTIDYGIARAFSNIAERLQEIAGVDVELYRLYEAVERGWIKIHGKRYDIIPIRDHAFAQLASAIASQANLLWTNDWDIDRVLVSGGGGAVLASYLEPQIKGKVVPIDPNDDSRLNNVSGYYNYGMRLWSTTTSKATATATKPAPEQVLKTKTAA